ncbi:MAG: carbohydrate kinase family protein [Anaerolineae bacterium]|nr:carbohydrate kinase family protein [Thermoflexales bacterium]MDW8293575.1 carbohydrate kinase family protein [Anaerolineae bacterium]
MEHPSILVVGCVSLDRIHVGGQSHDTIGGAGLHTALAARFAGAHVALVAPRPRTLTPLLQAAAKRLAWFGPTTDLAHMPRLEIAHHGDGKATLLGADWGAEAWLTESHLPDDLSRFAIVHIAALSSARKMLEFLHACRARGATRISAGTYYKIVRDEPATVRAIFEQADLFFMNENEAKGLWGDLRVVGRVAKRTREDALLFITFDRRGAVVIAGEQATPIPAEPAQERDPTGAGDTFCGATLAGLARGEDPFTAAQNAAVLAARAIEHIGPAYLLGLPLL